MARKHEKKTSGKCKISKFYTKFVSNDKDKWLPYMKSTIGGMGTKNKLKQGVLHDSLRDTAEGI